MGSLTRERILTASNSWFMATPSFSQHSPEMLSNVSTPILFGSLTFFTFLRNAEVKAENRNRYCHFFHCPWQRNTPQHVYYCYPLRSPHCSQSFGCIVLSIYDGEDNPLRLGFGAAYRCFLSCRSCFPCFIGFDFVKAWSKRLLWFLWIVSSLVYSFLYTYCHCYSHQSSSFYSYFMYTGQRNR